MLLRLTIASPLWRRIPRLKARLTKAALVAHEHLPKSLRFPVEVNLLLTTDAAVRWLNRDFRGIDKATNVLSFPQYEPNELRKIIRRKRLPPASGRERAVLISKEFSYCGYADIKTTVCPQYCSTRLISS